VSGNTKRTGLRSYSRGFTIIELMVSISILGVIAVGIMFAFTNYLALITRNGILVDMTVEAQNLLRATVEELRYGAGVRQINTITDANEPTGGWSTSNADFVIIIAMPAIDSDDNYIIDPSTGEPYNNEFVYFKEGTSLYKRILANPSAAGNTVVTSCPPSTASDSCPSDRLLHTALDNMVFTLYDQDDAATADPLLARSVKIDLSLMKDTFGDPLRLDYSIQTTLRNTF
jgi:prepilin-type N-terminal cleavage/methylation domain-containing protein